MKPKTLRGNPEGGLLSAKCSPSFGKMSKIALEIECYRLTQLQRHMTECALAAGFGSMTETIVAAKKYRTALEDIHRATGIGTDAEYARDLAHRISSANAEASHGNRDRQPTAPTTHKSP